jgi:hypothetical protein
MRPRPTGRSLRAGGCSSSRTTQFSSLGSRNCSRRIDPNQKSSNPSSAGSATYRHNRWHRTCPTRRYTRGYNRSLRPTCGRCSRNHAERWDPEDSVRGAQPRCLRSPRQYSNSESTRQPIRSRGVIAGRVWFAASRDRAIERQNRAR